MQPVRNEKPLTRISVRLTRWVGTPMSVIVHSVFFVGIFVIRYLGYSFEDILLILTTLVSLEAIYLSIFIQMSVNRSFQSLKEVEGDIDKIQDEVKDLGDDVEEISEDIDKIQAADEEDAVMDQKAHERLDTIQHGLHKLLEQVETLKKSTK